MNELHMIFKPGTPLDHLNSDWDEKKKCKSPSMYAEAIHGTGSLQDCLL
jgi:hypothetical protein